jgi:cytoskeletal protein RodZ
VEAQVNALIILAVALVAVGLLITLVLWLRAPHSAESEYVTVAELRARLDNEQEPTEEETAEEETGEEPGEDRPETGGTGAIPEPADDADRPAAAVVTPPTATGAGPDIPPTAESTPDTGGAEPGASGRTAKKPGAEPPPETGALGNPAKKPGDEPPPEPGEEPPAEKPGPDH